MVLCLLNLLKCHLVLAIKDKAVGDLLGEESKEIRKLLIKLIDLPLSDKLQQVRIVFVDDTEDCLFCFPFSRPSFRSFM